MKYLMIVLFFILPNVASATLTPGTIPVTKTGGSSPVLQNGSITDTGTASGTGNVGIGSQNPGQALDVQGTVRVSGVIQSYSIANDQVFNVKSYGAKGDGIHHNDGTVSAGSTNFTSTSASFTSNDVGKVIMIFQAGALINTTNNNNGDGTCPSTTAFTSASGSFAKGDVGKYISINGAGVAGATLITSISAYVSATAVTLATACSTSITTSNYSYSNVNDLTTTISGYVSSTAITLASSATTGVSGVDYTYGTDDTSAIQSAINAAGTAGGGTIFSPKGIYVINGSFGSNPASQLALPNVTLSYASPSTSSPTQFYKILGEVSRQWSMLSPVDSNGSVWLFTRYGSLTSNSGLGLYGTGTINSAHFSNITVDIQNMTFRNPSNYKGSPVDMTQALTLIADRDSFEPDYQPADTNHWIMPTWSGTYGLITPGIQNSGNNNLSNITMTNYYTGINLGEHGQINGVVIRGCVYAIELPHAVHSRMLTNADFEGNEYSLNWTGSSASPVHADHIEIERYSNSYWNGTNYDFNDPNDYGIGYLSYYASNDAGSSPLGVSVGADSVGIFNEGFQNVGIGTSIAHARLVVSGPTSYAQIGQTGTYGSGTIISGWSGVGLLTNNTYINSTGSAFLTVGSVIGSGIELTNNNVNIDTFSSSGTPTVVLSTNNRNVGIGTTVSVNAMSIVGATSIGDATSAGLTAPTNGLYVKGNVGIGSTNPGDILDVQGTVRVNGNLADGTTGNVGIGTAVANSATCDSTCNTAGKRCFVGITVPLTGFEPCSASISGDCLCLSIS